MFSGARAAGTRRSAAKKQQGPHPRQSDGPNISVTSENGVTEFTFTLTLA